MEYVRRGYRVVVFAFHGSTGPFRDLLESHDIECVDLNYLSRPRKVRRISYQWELFRFFKDRKVCAIHVHHALALTLCGLAARLAGVKHVVMTEHAIYQFLADSSYRRTARRYCRFASAITGVHSGITDYFRDELGVRSERLNVIPNGVPEFRRDDDARQQVRAGLGLDSSMFVCLYVGRFVDVKDLPTLLRAAAGLAEPIRRMTRVLLVGDGPERRGLESLCKSLALERTVLFLGERSDVPGLLNAADAFVMTSSTEGLPMALIEAMAAGLPCVATSVGGIPTLLAEGAGLVVPPGRPEEVERALTRLAEDPQLRRELSKRASLKARTKYGLKPVASAYLSLLGLSGSHHRASV